MRADRETWRSQESLFAILRKILQFTISYRVSVTGISNKMNSLLIWRPMNILSLFKKICCIMYFCVFSCAASSRITKFSLQSLSARVNTGLRRNFSSQSKVRLVSKNLTFNLWSYLNPRKMLTDFYRLDMVRRLMPSGTETFRTLPERPGADPASCYMHHSCCVSQYP